MHGLSTVVPLGVGWVERIVLVLPEIACGMWLHAGDVVYMNTHLLVHGSKECAVSHDSHWIVLSLFCYVNHLKAFKATACTIERWTEANTM